MEGVILIPLIIVGVGFVIGVIKKERWVYAAYGLLSGVIFFLVSMITLLIFEGNFKTTPTKVDEVNIYALKDDIQKGTRYIGSRGSTEEYYYIEKEELGSKMKKEDIEHSYIEEVTEGIQPVKETYELRFNNGLVRFMNGKFRIKEVYVFKVPEGSVTTEFEVDME